jgi:HSP20 family molecular chaperone IbpA
MTKRKEMTTNKTESVQERYDDVHAIRPPVDIYEDETGISLYADMPGVAKDRLEIKADRDSLSIEGNAEITTPENMTAQHTDVTTTVYRRNFTLSSELDNEKAEAELKDGVLKLHIPRRQQYQPRKIEVRAV